MGRSDLQMLRVTCRGCFLIHHLCTLRPLPTKEQLIASSFLFPRDLLSLKVDTGVEGALQALENVLSAAVP